MYCCNVISTHIHFYLQKDKIKISVAQEVLCSGGSRTLVPVPWVKGGGEPGTDGWELSAWMWLVRSSCTLSTLRRKRCLPVKPLGSLQQPGAGDSALAGQDVLLPTTSEAYCDSVRMRGCGRGPRLGSREFALAAGPCYTCLRTGTQLPVLALRLLPRLLLAGRRGALGLQACPSSQQRCGAQL